METAIVCCKPVRACFVDYWRTIMNDYFNTFQDIDQSVEQLLMDEHKSLEIKQSAASLKDSVKPCIEELKQSATRLKGLVQMGFDDLYHAEDIWNSKPRIAEAATYEIGNNLVRLVDVPLESVF
jgi:hypothetical protein